MHPQFSCPQMQNLCEVKSVRITIYYLPKGAMMKKELGVLFFFKLASAFSRPDSSALSAEAVLTQRRNPLWVIIWRTQSTKVEEFEPDSIMTKSFILPLWGRCRENRKSNIYHPQNKILDSPSELPLMVHNFSIFSTHH